MNLFHCLIFRCSQNEATRREGDPKSRRAAIQPHESKAVGMDPSRLPLTPDACAGRPTIEAFVSRDRDRAMHPFISESDWLGGPLEGSNTPQKARCRPRDDTSDTLEDANTHW